MERGTGALLEMIYQHCEDIIWIRPETCLDRRNIRSDELNSTQELLHSHVLYYMYCDDAVAGYNIRSQPNDIKPDGS
jgi:hypothetical protein